MSWFLKSKLRKQVKKINRLNNELEKALWKYNVLGNEYNSMNSFAPISPGVADEQTVTEDLAPKKKTSKTADDEVLEI